MGLTWGGETGKALREQANRIATCSLKFYWEGDTADGWTKGGGGDAPVLDFENDLDRAEITRRYGPEENWVRMEAT